MSQPLFDWSGDVTLPVSGKRRKVDVLADYFKARSGPSSEAKG